jgi:hemerythrin
MPLISWNEELSVGVAEIDKQHKQLIALLEELNDAMEQGRGSEVVGKVLDGVSRYTTIHFGTEEWYFDRFGYPDATDHKREHIYFVGKIHELRAASAAGQFGVSVDVLNLLGDWFLHHIKIVDKAYEQFFRANGLT